jgi:hypothetical protein
MKDSSWLMVEETQLYLNEISYKDMQDQDCDWDSIRCIVWVKRDSVTATQLALKGVRFNQPNPHKEWAQ